MAGKQLANGTHYSVVGRYMNGHEVIAYHLVGEDGETQAKVSKEQLIFLIAKELVLNCRVQMFNGKPLLRGKNININELPIVDEKKGEIRHNSNTTETKKSGAALLGRMEIIGRIMDKTNCVGYVVKDTGSIERKLSRANVIELLKRKLISNATIQLYNGSTLIRGKGVDLRELPIISVDTVKKSG